MIQELTTTYYNLLRDHLGSITHVVNASNNTLLYEYSYDSWGRMRNVSTWTNYAPGSEPSLFIAGRGFTGHEHLPWFNLINMNGRVYDPLVGQFLSPDNHVQAPYYTQGLNRYMYCLNNPLIYNDPSGEGVLLASLIFFVGQYAINWLDNVINEHMSAKEAFQNTPIIIGVKGTIPYEENKPPTNNYYESSGSGISEQDLEALGNYGVGGLQQYDYGYLASLGGVYAPEFILLGPGEPFLTKKVMPDPTNIYGRYELRLQVHGEMYSEYNWVQTAAYEDRLFTIDPNWEHNHGFYYDDWEIINLGRRYKAPDADFFFQDNPNAQYFNAELTLCGKRGENWYQLGTFAWGYSIRSGKIAFDYFRLINLRNTHLDNVIRTLKYFNINW